MSADAPSFDPAFVERLDVLLRWRRDVRRFDPRAVPAPDMAHLLETACLAPSVGNAQPWRIVRVRSARLRAALAEHVDAQAEAAGTIYDGTERRADYAALKLHGLREAPELLAVFCDEQPRAGHGLGRATMAETLRYSAVMAIHTLWLAARARGIGVGWVSILDPARVTRLLAAAEGWRLIALLCIGYPAEPSDTPELERHGWQAREPWADKVFER